MTSESLLPDLQGAREELKTGITKLINDFTDKYMGITSEFYPEAIPLLRGVLVESLSDIEYQIGMAPFTTHQIDHICYQIGNWYTLWQDRMWIDDKPNQHWLGRAKEDLKIMICGY